MVGCGWGSAGSFAPLVPERKLICCGSGGMGCGGAAGKVVARAALCAEECEARGRAEARGARAGGG